MIKAHPLADIFPLIEGPEFEALVEDIRVNSLRERIVILDGLILDGRNRYRAGIAAGEIDESFAPGDGAYLPHFEKFLDEDGPPLAFVLSRNLHRRHMNESQRAMVAARLENMKQGSPGKAGKDANWQVSRPDAADLLKVGERTVARAAIVRDNAEPELQRAVDQGKIAVSAAAQAAKLPVDQQRLVAAKATAGDANAARTVIKQGARAAREIVLGAKQLAAPSGLFGLILEDYEWDQEVWSRETGMDRHAANHYPVSDEAHTAAEIVERTKDRFACAAKDCLLAMWATAPHLAIAIDVMRLRGFAYKSHYVWGKDKSGPGYWNRGRHEILLIGTKGRIPCPAPGTQWDSLIIAPRREHSQKPDEFAQMLEAYFPTLPKIELNRRGPARPGWRAWGNEAEQTERIVDVGSDSDQLVSGDDAIDIPRFLDTGRVA